eukprot:NODE_4014_length_825_cov_52.957020_g3991_i0.p1 GENE.NODE_4014_length_825_cov_52.957020_g3991_i0~~NODE_4014_length_825_cov_52.957020_g3991_i0.p1  ORF type:complete len:205 (-),score=53.49 NODE_4014_length_825_cov_52.957020_g3991_i0:209-736(-)
MAEVVRLQTLLKYFILQCINGTLGDDRNKTPSQLLTLDMQFLEGEFERFNKPPVQAELRARIEQLQELGAAEQKNSVGGFLGKGISPLLPVQDEDTGLVFPKGGAASAVLGASEGEVVRPFDPLRFEPVCDRPRPPVKLPLYTGEILFLHSEGLFTDIAMDAALLAGTDEDDTKT